PRPPPRSPLLPYTTLFRSGLTTITGSAPPSGSLVQRAENGFGQGKVLASPFGMALAAATVREGRTPVPSLMDGDKVKATGLGKPDRKSTRLNSSHVKISYA